LSSLLILFANNILPIFLVAGSGYAMGKFFDIPPRPISQLAFNIFGPCLIFNLLTTTQLNSDDILRLSAFTVASILGLGALVLVIGGMLQIERRLLMAVLLATMFSNAGNFGLSVNLFAFGEKALAYASLYFAIALILTFTVGVIIASLGTSGWKAALSSLIKVPIVYAVLLAVLFKGFGWQLPLPLNRSVTLLGDAAIPVMMVLLGLQLQQSQWSPHTFALGLANVMRLLIAPALAVALSLAFGLQGEARQAGILESAMPTAVVTTVLANEYHLDAGFITSVVVSSTLLSPLTITPLLAYLGA
jgi:predicted permease